MSAGSKPPSRVGQPDANPGTRQGWGRATSSAPESTGCNKGPTPGPGLGRTVRLPLLPTPALGREQAPLLRAILPAVAWEVAVRGRSVTACPLRRHEPCVSDSIRPSPTLPSQPGYEGPMTPCGRQGTPGWWSGGGLAGSYAGRDPLARGAPRGRSPSRTLPHQLACLLAPSAIPVRPSRPP